MYEAQDFSSLLGTTGFSDEALQTHFGLYEGYVKNTNKVLELLSSLEKGSYEAAEVRRRFGWEFNGMRLHELYFGNMTSESQDGPEGDLLKAIERDFGSVSAWEEDFKATGAARGIGWAVLYADPVAGGKLMNTWINEHDGGHLSGATPVLIMDVFEHAFAFDYGMKRGEYIDAFMNAIDWNEAGSRLA
ncbi:MAG: superoxide dismutase [Candidatus Doudnabacteria bacterium]|nr:superoxide dismutase [Candidatus Doudnabacteria bacterium]